MRVALVLMALLLGCANSPEQRRLQCERYADILIALNEAVRDADGERLHRIQEDISRYQDLAKAIGCQIAEEVDAG